MLAARLKIHDARRLSKMPDVQNLAAHTASWQHCARYFRALQARSGDGCQKKPEKAKSQISLKNHEKPGFIAEKAIYFFTPGQWSMEKQGKK